MKFQTIPTRENLHCVLHESINNTDDWNLHTSTSVVINLIPAVSYRSEQLFVALDFEYGVVPFSDRWLINNRWKSILLTDIWRENLWCFQCFVSFQFAYRFAWCWKISGCVFKSPVNANVNNIFTSGLKTDYTSLPSCDVRVWLVICHFPRPAAEKTKCK